MCVCHQVEGYLVVTYDLGLRVHKVNGPMSVVSDNGYHVVRVVRSGSNLSLGLDDLPTVEYRPPGETQP